MAAGLKVRPYCQPRPSGRGRMYPQRISRGATSCGNDYTIHASLRDASVYIAPFHGLKAAVGNIDRPPACLFTSLKTRDGLNLGRPDWVLQHTYIGVSVGFGSAISRSLSRFCRLSCADRLPVRAFRLHGHLADCSRWRQRHQIQSYRLRSCGSGGCWTRDTECRR